MCVSVASGPAVKAIRVPSGDHVAPDTRCTPPTSRAASTTRRSPVPSGWIAMIQPVCVSTKAMSEPSGDHAGRSTFSGPSARTPVPSAFMTNSRIDEGGRPPAARSYPTNAILDPSGPVSPRSEASLVTPVPSGFMTYRPATAPPLENAIRPFRIGGDNVVDRGPAWKARIATTNPAAATNSARAATAIRRRGPAPGAASRGSRSPRSGQASGGRTLVNASKWSRRSGIAGLQELPEALARPAEVDVDGGSGAADDLGDLLRRISGDVVQHDGRPLLLGEPGERRHQVPCQVGHLVHTLDRFGAASASLPQFAGGDAEDRSPDPPLG